MRLFSWAGCAALAASGGVGFVAGESVNQHDAVVIRVCDANGELCDAPPVSMSPPRLVEDIDLTCPPAFPGVFVSQSMEPPLADASADSNTIRTASFELSAGAPAGPEAPSKMPYLTDENAPALLPPLGDVTELAPNAADPGSPLFHAVKSFVGDAARLPEPPAEITDKVPIGKPQVSEHPSTATPEKPAAPPSPKSGTTEIRPGDLPSKPTGDQF